MVDSLPQSTAVTGLSSSQPFGTFESVASTLCLSPSASRGVLESVACKSNSTDTAVKYARLHSALAAAATMGSTMLSFPARSLNEYSHAATPVAVIPSCERRASTVLPLPQSNSMRWRSAKLESVAEGMNESSW